ncbi:MAG: sigma-70 family RNA polymerase sigma factor [Pseudomonadota bacterium]
MSDEARRQLVALLPRLRRFAKVLARSDDQADDLLQAACERALTRLDQWQPGTRLDSWMYRIMQTVWIDWVRKNKVRGIPEPIEDQHDLSGSDGRQVVESQLELSAVRAAIKELPDEQRAVLGLVTIDGLSYKEAAEVLSLPIGTVMSRLSRARIRLGKVVAS